MTKSLIITFVKDDDLKKYHRFSPSKLHYPIIGKGGKRENVCTDKDFIAIECFSDGVESFIKEHLNNYREAFNFCLGGDVNAITDEGIIYNVSMGFHWSVSQPIISNSLLELIRSHDEFEIYIHFKDVWRKFDDEMHSWVKIE